MNNLFLNATYFTGKKFERATVLGMENAPLGWPTKDEGIEVEVMVQFKDAGVTPTDYQTNVESLLTDWEDRAMVKLLGSLKIGMNDSVYMMKYTGRFRIFFSCVDKCRMPLLNNGQVL